ncbi:hypothetical protein VPH49_25520 [Pseudomonas luteola]|uniref:hypothetical protein n=1 Tax=Pseudomonas luteola TaxID=47886 RepID=UPI003A88C2B5
MKGKIAIAAALAVIFGCSPEQRVISEAQAAASRLLKDPSSARFGEAYYVQDKDLNGFKTGHVCGYVNGKNSFGAYTGEVRFVASVVMGDNLLDISNVQIEQAGAERSPDDGFTPFESVYWKPSCEAKK